MREHQGARAAELDAVTIDASGTLVELVDPTDRLIQALADRGVDRLPKAVRAAFAAEVAYYVPRSSSGRDEETLLTLQKRSVGVFLEHLGTSLAADAFLSDFLAAIEFRPIAGVVGALDSLQRAGLKLACVANWDLTLSRHLRHAGIANFFSAIVSSAEAGAAKPDPAGFHLALEQLRVSPSRALHVGDDDVDRTGALAAGLAFEPTPLATIPERLGL